MTHHAHRVAHALITAVAFAGSAGVAAQNSFAVPSVSASELANAIDTTTFWGNFDPNRRFARNQVLYDVADIPVGQAMLRRPPAAARRWDASRSRPCTRPP